ncbi:MAG: hypothetical protein M5T61_06070 [Acidimicrobiia bacterium]|nr:hypothetical protein [Acidimicrobiia bacterium]
MVIGALALSALVVPGALVVAVVAVLALATIADGVVAGRRPNLRRSMSPILSRAVPSRLVVETGVRARAHPIAAAGGAGPAH